MKNTLTKIAHFLKKHIVVVVIVAVVVAAMGVAIGVILHKDNDKENVPQHEHTYIFEAIGPTCDHGGYILYTCACGDFYTVDKEAPLDHEYGDWEIVQPATVDNEGKKEQRCLNCNKCNTEVIPQIEEHEHVYKEEVVSPTCTDMGYTAQTCTICSYKTSKNETEPLGHSWSEWKETKKATADNPGEKTRSCQTCGEVETETIPPTNNSEHVHSYTSTVIEATCSTQGYTRHTCSCGSTYDDAKVSALGHLYGTWTVTVKPTTDSTGTRACTCTKCGHVLTETVAKLAPEIAEKYENYIDPRIHIEILPDGARYYYYSPVCVIDTRTWGDPPTISITGEGGFYVTYFKQDGSKVEWNLVPVPGYANRMVIWENGSYETGLIGGFDD